VNVEVIEIKNNKVVGTFSINLLGGNYHPSYEELHQEAWRCAIDDKLVDGSRKQDYKFRVIEE
jgi:hypothetical protein